MVIGVLHINLMTMQGKTVGNAGLAVGSPEFRECVPMVDKAIDSGWNREASSQSHFASKGMLI